MDRTDGARARIGQRQPVPELRERVRLLLASGRGPGIATVTALDHALGLTGERSFRQWYRGDRESGIPHDVLQEFLDIFRLRLDELMLPIAEFQRTIVAAPASDRSPIGWRGSEKFTQTARSSVRAPGDLLFDWPAIGIQVALVSERGSQSIADTRAPMQLLNLRRQHSSQARARLRTQFRFDLCLPDQAPRQLLGLVEGSELNCFHRPHILDRSVRQVRIPARGDPYYFDDLGRHTLWLLLFDGVRIDTVDLKELDHDDSRMRREAAERIYRRAQHDAPDSLLVLRTDFDVVA